MQNILFETAAAPILSAVPPWWDSHLYFSPMYWGKLHCKFSLFTITTSTSSSRMAPRLISARSWHMYITVPFSSHRKMHSSPDAISPLIHLLQHPPRFIRSSTVSPSLENQKGPNFAILRRFWDSEDPFELLSFNIHRHSSLVAWSIPNLLVTQGTHGWDLLTYVRLMRTLHLSNRNAFGVSRFSTSQVDPQDDQVKEVSVHITQPSYS